MNQQTKRPHKLKNALLVWLAIYPLITLLSIIFGDYLMMLPLIARTFALTIVAVPLVIFVIVPFYAKLFRRWL